MRDDTQKGPQLLAGLLAGITNAQGWRQQLNTHSLFLHWESIVDTTINTHAKPLKIVGNVLWLEITNSAWMQQLQFQKIQLLETVNKTLRLSHFTDIRFILASDRPSETQARPTVRFTQPSPAAQDSFQQQLAGIEDEKIRDSLMSLWYLSHSCQRNNYEL
jgi:predicted nucleic acid-binding Zn ribbon protein